MLHIAYVITSIVYLKKLNLLIQKKNTEKYITFAVLIEKEVTRIDKDRKEITKTLSYRLQFIDSPRFMTSFSSNLVNNLVH